MNCVGCRDLIVNHVDESLDPVEGADYQRDTPGDIWCITCFVQYIRFCEQCGDSEHINYMGYLNVPRRGEIFVCEGCRDDSWLCNSCDQFFNWDVDYNSDDWGDYYCGDCWTGCDCEECTEDRAIESGAVMSWDYQPDWQFFGRTDLTDTGPFFGMELETAWPGNINCLVELKRWQADLNIKDNPVVYVKTDSSIQNGFEIVTQPMTFEWAMENFPFDAFDKLCDKYGALATHATCGGHVHINKDSFTTAHLWKFLQLHHRLADFLEMAGGRASHQWGTLKGSDFEANRASAKWIAQNKRSRHGGRYQGVNLLPDYTVELRYPAGGSNAMLIKKNLQLAHAVWMFSKIVDVELFRNGILDDPGYFLWWISERDEYNELYTFVTKSVPVPKSFNVKENN